ncbi:hypothetical protein MLD38_000129 [Melastoma candidum]|uniref:Uncharacterized protein n=1 Tax=Melastoma candidum TaxID=119954 RepID=A0ACB9S912_9MYRT|nr:hypothetical protein MLD38_000129 [Melastoma candidum]
MGETTCFMQPFSYASGGLPGDHHHLPLEGNPIHHALTQSISFGRFASESPSWDRWSSFPCNRYVEEAEKFSRPGSVAQKKAFFEAHYKNMAARKKAAEEAAAKLEQANTAAIYGRESGVAESVSPGEGFPAVVNVACDSDKSVAVELSDGDPVPVTSEIDTRGSHIEIEKILLKTLRRSEASCTIREDISAGPVNREKNMKTFEEDRVNKEPPLQFPVLDLDPQNEAGDTESRGSAEMEKPLLKDFIREEASEPAVSYSKILRNPKSPPGIVSSPAVASLTPSPYWKENIATTPIARSYAVDCLDMKRSTPRRRLPLGYLATPVREINKATTISWRMGNPKPSSSLAKDCQTPAKTPLAPAHMTSKHPLKTPKTPAGDGKQTGPKRRSLAKECSKFLSACKNKLQSPSFSTPFRLRTEERAARRKEKLEEKFNAEREKLQLQHIIKEKEEIETKKFRQTLCFKARPLPKFYRENKPTAAKSPAKEVEPSCSELSRRSRKPWSKSNTTLPNRFSPNLLGKKLVHDMSLCDLALENRSPNIRQ